MIHQASDPGALITVGSDQRITRVGLLLRATKIDELPQLINVIKGEMSLVGPRPEVKPYVEMFRNEYREVLRVRPGITDPSSLKYQNEAQILAQSESPEREYVKRILPDKIALSTEYSLKASFWLDLSIIFKTIPKLFGRRTGL
jgi:lipopolysaccharide/colanic/teichoic acid biosynthesis glycosyltransferase